MKYFQHLFCLLTIVTCQHYTAQSITKSGVNTTTPTETLDINGNLRIRTLPKNGDANAIYTTGQDTSSGSTPTVTYNATTPLVNSTPYNVIGKSSSSNLIPNNGSNAFNTSNTSSAMFVIKRFSIGDWPTGQDTNKGFDTTMSVANWEAVMSNVSYSMTVLDHIPNVFQNQPQHGWGLQAINGGTWRVIGDINGVREKSDFVDILFIKKSNVAADNRTVTY